jgi:hypothetical protein
MPAVQLLSVNSIPPQDSSSVQHHLKMSIFGPSLFSGYLQPRALGSSATLRILVGHMSTMYLLVAASKGGMTLLSAPAKRQNIQSVEVSSLKT